MTTTQCSERQSKTPLAGFATSGFSRVNEWSLGTAAEVRDSTSTSTLNVLIGYMRWFTERAMNTHLNPWIDGDHSIYYGGFSADKQAKAEWSDDYINQDYLSWALSNVKNSMNSILERFPDRAYYKLFIGGKLNYRNEISRLAKYKGNRDKAHRPKYYEEMRSYLVERFRAEYSDGREADDEVSIGQWSHKDKSTCIVSYDKDLKNTPGWHWNYMSKELTYITRKEADLNWLGQCGTGDAADNVPGLKGFGPRGLDKLLFKCNNDARLLRKEIEALYKKQYGTKAQEAFHETASLVWIMRDSWINYDGSRIEKPTAPPTTEEKTDVLADPA